MKKKMKYGLLLLLLVVTTGCTTYLKNSDGKPVTNPTTGQSLAENILCRPTDEETIKLYEDNNYDLSKFTKSAIESIIKVGLRSAFLNSSKVVSPLKTATVSTPALRPATISV